MSKTGAIKAFIVLLFATAIIPNVFARPNMGVCGGIILEEYEEDEALISKPTTIVPEAELHE